MLERLIKAGMEFPVSMREKEGARRPGPWDGGMARKKIHRGRNAWTELWKGHSQTDPGVGTWSRGEKAGQAEG